MTNSNREIQIIELDAAELFRLGTETLVSGQYAAAHRYLQAALEKERSADHLSQYGVALAHHAGNIRTGISLCQEAVKKEPKNPEHFRRLGMVYLIAGRKKEAVRIFHLGLRVGKNAGIAKMLQALGHREKPMVPFLSRTNPLNKLLGKIRMSLAKRR